MGNHAANCGIASAVKLATVLGGAVERTGAQALARLTGVGLRTDAPVVTGCAVRFGRALALTIRRIAGDDLAGLVRTPDVIAPVDLAGTQAAIIVDLVAVVAFLSRIKDAVATNLQPASW